MRLHPFGEMTFTIAALSLVSFGLAPFGLRLLLGSSSAVLVVALLVGSLSYTAGLWFLRRTLQLEALRGAVRRRSTPSRAESSS